MSKYRAGKRVKITSDNESYDEFKNNVLTISDVSTSVEEHPGYDEGCGGVLMDFYPVNGVEIPFSLYDWEVELI